MTDGPEAEVGEILAVNWPHPRERAALLAHPDFYRLREHLITFLEARAHKKGRIAPKAPAAPAVDGTKRTAVPRGIADHQAGLVLAGRLSPEETLSGNHPRT